MTDMPATGSPMAGVVLPSPSGAWESPRFHNRHTSTFEKKRSVTVEIITDQGV